MCWTANKWWLKCLAGRGGRDPGQSVQAGGEIRAESGRHQRAAGVRQARAI